MALTATDASPLATRPSITIGECNIISGGMMIAGNYSSTTHVHNIFPHAEPNDSSKSRDTLISDITAWFDLKSNSRAIHNDVRKKRIDGTGYWFINSKEYQDWKGTKGAVLCGTGIPGAGKTVLMSRVVDDLLLLEESVQNVCVLLIYNRYNETLSIGDILKSFILQIIQRHNHLVDLVQPLYRSGRLERTAPSDDDLLKLLLKLEGHFQRTYYIVDGFDEVDRKYQLNLIKVLAQLQGNLIFSSRPSEHLRTELEGARHMTLLAQEEDLRLLVDNRLGHYKGLCRILEKHHYREEATRKIADKAAGMFLHAALQIEALRNCLSLSAIEAKLEQFPTGIEGMYTASISRIESQDPDLVKIAKQLLLWVVFARGPLSLRDLKAALGANPDTYSVEESLMPDEFSIVELCCGLVELDTESDVVRLVHFTAREALERVLLRDFPHPHLFISKVLAQRMVDNNLPNCTIAKREDFTSVVKQVPLLRYSYQHWGTHVLECGRSPEATDATMAFLRQCTSFPCDLGWGTLDLLQPLHVAAYYGISIYLDRVSDSEGNPNGQTHPSSIVGAGLLQPGRHPAEGVQINGLTTVLRHTALMIASAHGRIHFVKRCLRIRSISINGRNERGETALFFASAFGHEEVVKELLQFWGVNVNATDNHGWTALMIASVQGHDRVVHRLLQFHGIDVNTTDNEGWTALMFTSQDGHDGIVNQLLQFHGINVNAADKEGWTALMLASFDGHDRVVRRLLQFHGVSVNARTHHNSTALTLASEYGYEMVVQQLLEHGADVNAADNDGDTSLIMASGAGYEGIVARLLQCPGIDIHAANESGTTALSAAREKGHAAIVEM
ncbi:ankyrin repeat domain-containing protein 50 [Coprinopsis cinerea AmutBmut pab1-1]|nr:ankyrin repeat domain-containing protein 50 [Coprinopsis cinerea AmutBmut pab1-1]